MRVLGEITLTETAGLPAHGDFADFAVVFGRYDLDQFKRELRPYPRAAVTALTDKPVRYCRVDWGNPAGAPKAYRDVCRNYDFFVFESRNDMRWMQRHKGLPSFFRMNRTNTPSDMYAKLSRGRSGLEFLGFFYGRLRGVVRS